MRPPIITNRRPASRLESNELSLHQTQGVSPAGVRRTSSATCVTATTSTASTPTPPCPTTPTASCPTPPNAPRPDTPPSSPTASTTPKPSTTATPPRGCPPTPAPLTAAWPTRSPQPGPRWPGAPPRPRPSRPARRSARYAPTAAVLTPNANASTTRCAWPPTTPSRTWPDCCPATTPAPTTRPAPCSPRSSPPPPTCRPSAPSCTCASTPYQHPAAPEPSPACAPTSPLPARPTPAPTSPSSTPSNTDEPCTQYQGVSGGLDSHVVGTGLHRTLRSGGAPVPGMQVTRPVTVELDDDVVGIAELERAALEFARTAPGALVAATIEAMLAELITTVIGPFGDPWPVDRQLVAPWGCTGCGSMQGFRRRGAASKPRTLAASCGKVAFRSPCVQCLACGRRFAPAPQLLGLRAYQRRTDELSRMAAGLAGEVAYAKASRLLAELAGQSVSARSIRRDVLAMAPERIVADGPVDAPVLLLDGTGERAGAGKGGVELHLAIGLVARRKVDGRVRVEARLLAATLDEPWTAMDTLLHPDAGRLVFGHKGRPE